MKYKTIKVEVNKSIVVVTLSCVRYGDAVNKEMALELREAFVELGQDDNVLAVILTGEGGVFCKASVDSKTRKDIELLKAASSVASVSKPVIAAINGDAIDQGLEIALACDVRIAARGTRLGLAQVQKGYLPWDGGTQRLARLVGPSWANYLLLTSAVLSAEEALGIGLVNEVAEGGKVMDRAMELASEIVKAGPIALRYAKEAVMKGADMTLEQGLGLEADLSILLQSTQDRAEGIKSFLAKRKPWYRGR